MLGYDLFCSNALNEMKWEIPQSKIHPCNNHCCIGSNLDRYVGDIHNNLENSDGPVGHIVDIHNYCSDREEVKVVGKQD